MDAEQWAIDFYNGVGALQLLSAWSRVIADPDAIRELVMKLENAFVELGRLQDEGKLYRVNVLASTETLEAIRRLHDLIKSDLDASQAPRASEIHTLAEQCLNAIKSDPATVATIRAQNETQMA